MSSIWAQRQTRPAQPLLGHLRQPRPARAHERVLRDHEERVDQHEQRGQDDEQCLHRSRPGTRRAGRGNRLPHALRHCAATSGWVLVSHAATAGKVAAARAGTDRRRRGLGKRVEPAGEVEIRLGDTAGGVSGERERDLVVAVDGDVRVMVGRLGRLGHPVDEGDRRREVVELQLADDRVALALPVAVRPGAPRWLGLSAFRPWFCAAELIPPGGR